MGYEETSGGALSLKSGQWKGGNTHNGTLKKIHDFSFVEGYSELTHPIAVTPEFGFGVFEDAADKTNKVSTQVTGLTTPMFGGVLIRSPAMAAGQPAANKSVLPYNKGARAKRGFVVYKSGFTIAGDAQGWADIAKGMNLFITNANGRPHFASAVTVTGATLAGKIIAINPDDKSWTVEVGNSEAMAAQANAITLSDITDLDDLTITRSQITDLAALAITKSQITDLDELNINELEGVNFTTLTIGQILKADATGILVPAADAIAE